MRCAERGIACVVTREPGGTPGAEAIRALLLDRRRGLEPARRGAAVRRRALRPRRTADPPGAVAGKWVICDRFVDSSRAYQGGAGGLSDADILDLHRVGSLGLLPDLTLLIEVPARSRRRSEPPRAMGMRRPDRRARRRLSRPRCRGFARLAEAEPRALPGSTASGMRERPMRKVMAALAPVYRWLAPWRMAPLIGHDEAWREWRAPSTSERMHHGWILAGPKGVGKGAFARAAAARAGRRTGRWRSRPPTAIPTSSCSSIRPRTRRKPRSATRASPIERKRNDHRSTRSARCSTGSTRARRWAAAAWSSSIRPTIWKRRGQRAAQEP
jgi:dTMP kinase